MASDRPQQLRVAGYGPLEGRGAYPEPAGCPGLHPTLGLESGAEDLGFLDVVAVAHRSELVASGHCCERIRSRIRGARFCRGHQIDQVDGGE